MRTLGQVLLLAPALALATPAAADQVEIIKDDVCMAAFSALRFRATPEIQARLDAGLKAAQAAYLAANPKVTAQDLPRIADYRILDMTKELRSGKLLPDQVNARANACEAKYGLPKTDFPK